MKPLDMKPLDISGISFRNGDVTYPTFLNSGRFFKFIGNWNVCNVGIYEKGKSIYIKYKNGEIERKLRATFLYREYDDTNIFNCQKCGDVRTDDALRHLLVHASSPGIFLKRITENKLEIPEIEILNRYMDVDWTKFIKRFLNKDKIKQAKINKELQKHIAIKNEIINRNDFFSSENGDLKYHKKNNYWTYFDGSNFKKTSKNSIYSDLESGLIK